MIGTIQLTALENTIMSESFKGKKVKGAEHYADNIVGNIMVGMGALNEDWEIEKYSGIKNNKNVYQIGNGKKNILVYCMSCNPDKGGNPINNYLTRNVVNRLNEVSDVDWWHVWIDQRLGLKQKYIFYENSEAVNYMIKNNGFTIRDNDKDYWLHTNIINSLQDGEWEIDKSHNVNVVNAHRGKQSFDTDVAVALSRCISENMLKEGKYE